MANLGTSNKGMESSVCPPPLKNLKPTRSTCLPLR